MTFEEVMLSLKAGKRVQRAGWNGKGMFLTMFSASNFVVVGEIIDEEDVDNHINGHDLSEEEIEDQVTFLTEGMDGDLEHMGCLFTMEDGEEEFCPMQDFILMKTVQGTVVPWLASQTDILAYDWEVIELL